MRKVTPGTHTHSKYINPAELVSFFQTYRGNADSRPWISTTSSAGPRRTEAEARGIIYVPWLARWVLTPRSLRASGWNFGEVCNYLFWVRKPL
jgi:polyprenyldihydroxybenzoate methyltransferase / 3-demethylubiquinol 3-O-methyltransferase